MTSPFKSITLCALTAHLPNILSIVHISRRTPWAAILMTSVLSMLFIFAGDIAFVANVAYFTLFITFFVINAAMIVLRYKEPDVKDLSGFRSR